MKTITLAALALASVSAFAQETKPMWTPGQPMMGKVVLGDNYYNEMLPEGNAARAAFIKSKVFMYAKDLPASQQSALSRINNNYSERDTLSIFTGIYNNIVRSKQLRTEMALAKLSPELRATISTDGYTMLGEGEGRALKMVAERPSTSISYQEASRILSADLNGFWMPVVMDAFWSADEADKDGVVAILRGLAMDAKAPVYASTLIQRSYMAR